MAQPPLLPLPALSLSCSLSGIMEAISAQDWLTPRECITGKVATGQHARALWRTMSWRLTQELAPGCPHHPIPRWLPEPSTCSCSFSSSLHRGLCWHQVPTPALSIFNNEGGWSPHGEGLCPLLELDILCFLADG